MLNEVGWKEQFKAEISRAIRENPVPVGPVHSISVPKGRFTFRDVSQLSLTDTLKYTALVLAIAPTIETSRKKPSVVFSNRFTPRKPVKVDRSRYDDFREASSELSSSGKYSVKVITDLANFYDRLNIHALENILHQIGCDKSITAKLVKLLIFWSGQRSFGLPVGSDASRILAEAMLINVDNELAKRRIKFIRYVDDFRIFCKSTDKAYEAMQILSVSLAQEGLFLNSGKTAMIDLREERHEEGKEDQAFAPIDESLTEETTRRVQDGYKTRIAKFYKYPGKEAIKGFRQMNLEAELGKLTGSDALEDELKTFIKAAMYAEVPKFEHFREVSVRFPHLIPYIADALTKEFSSSEQRFADSFNAAASKYFRDVFRKYSQNDYFRIQSARVLCLFDTKSGEFLSEQLLNIEPPREILFSQLVYMLNEDITRPCLLKLLANIASYGQTSRLAIVWCLQRSQVLATEKRRAQARLLKGTQTDWIISKLLS